MNCNYIKENRSKLFQTSLLLLTFIGLGGCCTILGAVFFDIQILLQISFTKTTNLISCRAIGFIFGSLITTFIDKILSAQLTLSLSSLIASISISAACFLKSYPLIYSILLISGIAQAILDIVCNTYLMKIWRNDAKLPMYILLLHGCFGVGSIITPLLAKPFLLYKNDEYNSNYNEDISFDFKKYNSQNVQIQYPLIIIGLILLLASVGFLICYFVSSENKKTTSNQNIACKPDSIQKKQNKIISIIWVCLIGNLTFGIQTVIGSLCSTFAVTSQLNMPVNKSVVLVTVFWSLFTVYRVVFISLNNCISTSNLMLANYSFLLLGSLLGVLYCNTITIWICMMLIGSGFSPIFAISLDKLQKYFPLTNSITSLIFLISSTGETIHPMLASKLMILNVNYYIYYLAFLCITYIIVSFTLPILCKKLLK